LFQWYLLQWIEIENRAMQFVDKHNLHDRCFVLHSPRDLNDANKIREMFEFFGLPLKSDRVLLAGRKNQSFGYKSLESAEEHEQFAEVISRIPEHYLEIFRREPYCNFGWSNRLRRSEPQSSLHHAH
jgi:hypothetical protein